MKLGIVDYGGGNLQSVRNAVAVHGADAPYVSTPEALAACDAIIFPGQGEFGDSMAALRSRGLAEPLREWIAADRPFFGICLGYQLLFSGSEENPGVEGLGAFAGNVVRFPRRKGLKVPHMGWNRVDVTEPADPAWAGLSADPHFYFVHSYYPVPEDNSLIAATSSYDGPFACAIQRGNVIATQFHPEKSQASGLQLLRNFLTKHHFPLPPPVQ